MKIKLKPQGLEPLGFAVFITIATVVICYMIRPELIGIRSAFSSLGAFPPTSYLFTSGFILSGCFIFSDGLMTRNLFQKICRFLATIGFFMLGIFQIEHSQLRGDLHRLGGLIMLLAIISSMIGHLIAEWKFLLPHRRVLFTFFSILAVVSVTMSILSSAQFKIMTLQGLAQYLGLISLIGWAMMDSADNKIRI